MKKLLIIATLLFASLPATVKASLESSQVQKLELSAQCKSAFGNVFCSGESACREVAAADAAAKNCKADIKKVDYAKQPDYISNGIVYRSYNCQIEQQAECSQ